VLTAATVAVMAAIRFNLRRKQAEISKQEVENSQRSGYVAANAMKLLPSDIPGARHAAVKAVRSAPTPDAIDALRQTLLISGAFKLEDAPREGRYALLGGSNSVVTIEKDLIRPDQESVTVWSSCYRREGQGGGVQPIGAYTARGKFSGLATASRASLIAASGAVGEVNLFDDRVYSASDDCGIIQEQNLRLLHSFPSPSGAQATAVALSRDGTLIGATYHDTKSRIWNTRTFESVELDLGYSAVVARFSANGQYFLTAGNDPTTGMAIWDVWQWQKEPPVRWKQTMQAATPTAIAVSPDMKLLVMGHEKTKSGSEAWLLADFRDGASDARNHEHLSLHESGITAVDFSEDGRYLYTASRDRTIRVWGVEHTGRDSEFKGEDRHVFVLRGEKEAIISMSWSDDKKTMATFCADGWILMRNIDPGVFRASPEDLLRMADQ